MRVCVVGVIVVVLGALLLLFIDVVPSEELTIGRMNHIQAATLEYYKETGTFVTNSADLVSFSLRNPKIGPVRMMDGNGEPLIFKYLDAGRYRILCVEHSALTNSIEFCVR